MRVEHGGHHEEKLVISVGDDGHLQRIYLPKIDVSFTVRELVFHNVRNSFPAGILKKVYSWKMAHIPILPILKCKMPKKERSMYDMIIYDQNIRIFFR